MAAHVSVQDNRIQNIFLSKRNVDEAELHKQDD